MVLGAEYGPRAVVLILFSNQIWSRSVASYELNQIELTHTINKLFQNEINGLKKTIWIEKQ